MRDARSVGLMARLRARRGDEGFTLVETVVALGIAAVVFSALASATIASLRGSLIARQNQMASDMTVQALEKVRALDFVNIAHSTADTSLAADGAVDNDRFDPGTGTLEDLIFLPAGIEGPLSPHTVVENRNSIDYDVSTYVTVPAGYGTESKRVTVVVTWDDRGSLRIQQQSTLITETRRGLPLPRFLLSTLSSPTLTQGPSTQVSYGFRLHNYGARDAWNIAAPAGLTWTFYRDLNGDGIKDALDVTPLSDSDGDGVVDTGKIEVNGDAYFLAVATAPATLGTWTGQLTVTSSAQPAAASAAQSLPLSLTTSGAPPPLPTPSPTGTSTPSPTPTATGPAQIPWPLPTASCVSLPCSFPIYWLHENPASAHAHSSTAPEMSTNSAMGAAGPTNYSVGKPGSAGRYLNIGGSLLTETDATRVADWRFQAPAKVTVKAGQAVATLYVSCLVGSGPLTVNVAVGQANIRGLSDFTSQGTGSATLAECTSEFTPVVVPVSVADFSITKNKYLVMRATLPGSSTSDVRIGYDWAAAPSSLVVAQ